MIRTNRCAQPFVVPNLFPVRPKPDQHGHIRRQALAQPPQQVAQLRRSADQFQAGDAHHRHAAYVQWADRGPCGRRVRHDR